MLCRRVFCQHCLAWDMFPDNGYNQDECRQHRNWLLFLCRCLIYIWPYRSFRDSYNIRHPPFYIVPDVFVSMIALPVYYFFQLVLLRPMREVPYRVYDIRQLRIAEHRILVNGQEYQKDNRPTAHKMKGISPYRGFLSVTVQYLRWHF